MLNSLAFWSLKSGLKCYVWEIGWRVYGEILEPQTDRLNEHVACKTTVSDV